MSNDRVISLPQENKKSAIPTVTIKVPMPKNVKPPAQETPKRPSR